MYKPKNVIIFGETGVGKSSVINLMAGREVALTSPNLKACTLQATQHLFSLPAEVPLRIFDTVGLEEPYFGVNTFLGAIEKAHELVTSLHRAGGIDLLLFCIKGGRITAAMQRSYRLFFEILCESRVPLAIVVTNLETEDVMEDWWARNETTFLHHGIHSVAHACITAVPARITMYAKKRAESQIALQKMLLDTLNNPNPSYVQEIRSWFTAIVYLLRSFLMTNRKRSLKKRDLMRRLETRCKLSRSDAEMLVQILTNERDIRMCNTAV